MASALPAGGSEGAGGAAARPHGLFCVGRSPLPVSLRTASGCLTVEHPAGWEGTPSCCPQPRPGLQAASSRPVSVAAAEMRGLGLAAPRPGRAELGAGSVRLGVCLLGAGPPQLPAPRLCSLCGTGSPGGARAQVGKCPGRRPLPAQVQGGDGRPAHVAGRTRSRQRDSLGDCQPSLPAEPRPLPHPHPGCFPSRVERQPPGRAVTLAEADVRPGERFSWQLGGGTEVLIQPHSRDTAPPLSQAESGALGWASGEGNQSLGWGLSDFRGKPPCEHSGSSSPWPFPWPLTWGVAPVPPNSRLLFQTLPRHHRPAPSWQPLRQGWGAPLALALPLPPQSLCLGAAACPP